MRSNLLIADDVSICIVLIIFMQVLIKGGGKNVFGARNRP